MLSNNRQYRRFFSSQLMPISISWAASILPESCQDPENDISFIYVINNIIWILLKRTK